MSEENTERQNPPEHWQGVYTRGPIQELPWFSEQLEPDFTEALSRSGIRPEDGPVLDIGAGPGTVARELARMGYHVTAADVAPAAIEAARQRAGDLADQIHWVVDNILDTHLTEPFAFAHDRGCFHVFNDEERPGYLRSVSRLLPPGAVLFLKTFSKRQEGDWGPRRYSMEEIRDFFSPAFVVESCQESIFQGTLETNPLALFCVLRRAVG